MNVGLKFGSIGTLILSLLLVAAPSGAQKSLADGVDELATKLAKSYGDGKRGKVAIVPLRELGGGENLLGYYIAETLTNSFFDVGYRDIVERQMLDRALQELKLSLTGMIDAESAKKIGKFLHADLVVGGTMTDLTGEVSVNCRMFAVETGQVVAVATTKIVKDDSVKSMSAKGTAAAGGSKSPGTESEPAGVVERKPPSKPAPQQQVKGILFEFRGCSISGASVDCKFLMTSKSEDQEVSFGGSRLVDEEGNEYRAERVVAGAADSRRGGAASLASGIPLKGQIVFRDVPPDIKKGALIEIYFWIRPEIQSERALFRDVSLAYD